MSIQNFLSQFKSPSTEYTLIPFWFLNDRFDADTLRRQLRDFHAHGVHGIVLHPRAGVPHDIPYMSDAFLDAIEVCVQEAAALGMRVVLYDEGMYPSGSACGQVVARDPRFATRRLERHRELPEGAELVTAIGGWYYTLGYSDGRIRGIHDDQDDLMPNAPKAGDLLNYDAMRAFIELTHERYYARVGQYFGSTIIGMFTDEPSVSGRGGELGPAGTWTYGLLEEFEARLPEGFDLSDALDALFDESHPRRVEAKQLQKETITARLADAFFRQQGDWCRAHGIALMGHPSGSGETAPLVHFGIPGQDLVWRYVEPGDATGNFESVLGKSAVDMARLTGARRNSNEAFGCCSQKDNPWEFGFDEMLWYANFLLVRGCNLILPHAFFYSLRLPIQHDERPPDVGPGNIWWPVYREFADYCARICMINTDSRPAPQIGVFSDGVSSPWRCVKPLWEQGVEFAYVSQAIPGLTDCFDGGRLVVNGYEFTTLFWEEDVILSPALTQALAGFEAAGGVIVRRDFEAHVPATPSVFAPAATGLRRTALQREGVAIHMLFNEGETPVSGVYTLPGTGALRRLDAFTGDSAAIPSQASDGKLSASLSIAPGELVILAVDPDGAPAAQEASRWEEIALAFRCGETCPEAAVMDAAFGLAALPTQAKLAFEDVHDLARVMVNGHPAGILYRKPFEVDITQHLVPGVNHVHLDVLGSRANRYGRPVPMGAAGATVRMR